MLFTTQTIYPQRIELMHAPHPDGVCGALNLPFDTTSAVLHARQRVAVQFIAYEFTRSSYLEVFGRADRAGDDASNLDLSARRAAEVRKQFAALGITAGALFGFSCRALGERYEALCGDRDGRRSAAGRSAWVFHWPSKQAHDDGLRSNHRQLLAYARKYGHPVP